MVGLLLAVVLVRSHRFIASVARWVLMRSHRFIAVVLPVLRLVALVVVLLRTGRAVGRRDRKSVV